MEGRVMAFHAMEPTMSGMAKMMCIRLPTRVFWTMERIAPDSQGA